MTMSPLLKITAITVFLIVIFTSPFVCLSGCPKQESEALLSLNFTFKATNFFNPWTNDTDCCKWHAIKCDVNNSHVVGISVGMMGGLLIDDGISGGVISDSLCELPFLTEIDIWDTGATGTLSSCLGDLHYLQSLRIVNSKLSGIIPLSICILTNLTQLNLEGNQLSGSLPFCLNNLSYLSTLSLANNRLSGPIPLTWGDLSLLKYLDVSSNQLSGLLPSSFTRLSSLTELYAQGNKFNESISSSPLPSSISSLSLSLNHKLTISETFFHNLTKLDHLSLSNCTLNISMSWIPNFQLRMLELVSCQMNNQIPPWISTQFSLGSLTLANNGLVGEIPSWLWAMTSLSELNVSQNHLHGSLLPDTSSSKISVLDVSSNELSGWIPSMWPRSEFSPPQGFLLMLNDNLFTGNIPPSLCNLSPSIELSLESNKLDGRIPWCLIESGSTVQYLNLGRNSLEGRMPQGLIISSGIISLVIRNNHLSGEFLPSFTNYSALRILDIGHNQFTGNLPRSIGNISSLQVLLMNDNQFSGNIITEIGDLKNLQILDLSSNNLSGSIPHSIVFLKAMLVAREDAYVTYNELDYGGYVIRKVFSLGGLDMILKGTKQHYPYIFSTFTGIDLSNNQLNGDVPVDFGMLKGLIFLNLSMNNLSGIIPYSLGDMSQLEALDLSSNNLSGNIPLEFQSLNYLGYLNLSNNNLSGSIPQGGQMITFENTSYSGNQYLQGCPLPKNCSWPEFTPPPPLSDAEDKNEEESEQIPWYQIGLGWSYGAGFLIVVVLLLSVKERWRKKYLTGVDNILKFMFPFLRNRTL